MLNTLLKDHAMTIASKRGLYTGLCSGLYTGMCSVIFAAMLLATAHAAQPNSAPAGGESGTVSGKVLEIKDVDQYTYLRLKTSSGETWAAVEKTALKVGKQVTISNVMVMTNFESKTLHKTFPTILFGSIAGAAPNAKSTTAPMEGNAANPHGKPPATGADTTIVKVDKASGPNAYTVAELVTRAAELNGKPVVVRAKAMKFNPDIMGKNWIHLSDGSGDATNHSDDILATSKEEVKVGNVVTLTGVLRVDQDFGSGYSYKVLIENATLKP
jgi:hypothetical protein